jgi:hypothetical protein
VNYAIALPNAWRVFGGLGSVAALGRTSCSGYTQLGPQANQPAVAAIPVTFVATRADLVNAFVGVLVEVGWTATAIAGGFRCLGVSPQGYSVYADIWDDGTRLTVQLVSFVYGSPTTGYGHPLRFDASLMWRIVAHPAGFAISRPDTSGDVGGSCVLVGIPRVPDGCGLAAAQTIAEAWFSFGDGGWSPFFTQSGPRRNLDIGTDAHGNQTGCVNGVIYPLAAPGDFSGAGWSEPQIVRQSSADADNGGPGATNSRPLWYDGTDLLYPALVAWGDAPEYPVKVRGQVYNAAVRSSSTARDALKSWDEIDWINYTDSYYWGALWLMLGAESLSNVAY